MSISYKTLAAILYQEAELNPVSEPSLVLYNTSLAQDLSFMFDQNVFTELLLGNNIVFDPKPIAQAYSGHQFGHYNILGDGRAMLIDEIIDKNGRKIDIQLKGSGATPYARRGDGKATLSAMLREYIYSEAMHALHIPTTRSLAVLSTGEPVYREKVHMGGVLVRTAESHIRVGTFEFARQKGNLEELKELTDYTIKRHYAYLEKEADKYLKFLNEVMFRQIDLIVNWCRVGFVHGVMNTDNVSIAGQTIDYGPCAFLNTYNESAVFSKIDEQGRYAFNQQSPIALWNLTRFAETLLPLIDENIESAVQKATQILENFRVQFDQKYHEMLCEKLGLNYKTPHAFIDELLNWMQANEADYTNTFLKLFDNELITDEVYDDPAFITWQKKWESLRPNKALMKKANPVYIPRNHLIEEALLEVENQGDLTWFNSLLAVIQKPFIYSNPSSAFIIPPKGFDKLHQTHCNT